MSSYLFNNFLTKSGKLMEWSRGYRAYDPARNSMLSPGPFAVQIQTIDRCNADCVMCPYSAATHSGSPKRMDDKLFTHIIKQLHHTGSLRHICFMLQNEPFLDLQLEERLGQAKAILGKSVAVRTVTNGALLTPKRIERLRDSGLDRIGISIDAACEDTYRKIRKGLDYKTVVDNTKMLIDTMGGPQVVVRFLRQKDNEGEEIAFARYWKGKGAKVRFDAMNNRAGKLSEYDRIAPPKTGMVRKAVHFSMGRFIPVCPLPFMSLSIKWDGRVLACYEDWNSEVIIGDLSKQTLDEVWNSEIMNHHRHMLYSRRAKESPLCGGCKGVDTIWKN